MKKILVTGARGFVGSNLIVNLRSREDIELAAIDAEDSAAKFESAVLAAELIFHLAGVNRPTDPSEFARINAGLTQSMCDCLIRAGRAPKIVLASSIQVDFDNPYGRSKRDAEDALKQYSRSTGAAVVVHRLKNLFGKWCRPNYNSVTATFCHNIAHDLPIQISDPSKSIELTYVDDVIDAFALELTARSEGFRVAEPLTSTELTLGELAGLVRSFRAQRDTLMLPELSSRFVRAVYATYLSYLDAKDIAYSLSARTDSRGTLAEFVKQPSFGQLFVSRTKPGVTRGNHFHSTKTEKFLVVEGNAVIRLRRIGGDDVIEFTVRGDEFRVVDIPPGYTHSIENIGDGELVTLFWASEVFDAARPDTMSESVLE